MTRRLLVIALVAAAGAALAAQNAPRPSHPQPDRYAVTLEGCVRGGLFVPKSQGASRAQSEILLVAEYQLRGPRAVLRLLRDEHQGHEEQITGIVEVPREPTRHAGVFTKEMGKGRVVVGRREDRALTDTAAARPATLTIESMRHVADSCTDK